MKIFECKCGSTEVFIEQSGNNTGLYCAECGKWITWLNKDQIRLAQRQIENHDKQIRAEVITEISREMRMLYGNEYESKIRADAIGEYMNKLCDKCIQTPNECWNLECPFADDECQIIKIADELKEQNI